MRNLFILLMLQIILSGFIFAQETASVNMPEVEVFGDTNDLQIYLELSAKNNPGLKAAFESWKAALSVVPQAEALSDPRFTFTYFVEEIETRLGPQSSKIGIAQAFPWFGKLDAKKDSATAMAEAVRYDFESKKLDLFYRVKKAYYEYSYVGTALKIASENKKLLVHYESIARTKYQTSTAMHPDVIRAQIELALIDDVIQNLQGLQEPLVSELKNAMNLDKGAERIEFDWPVKLQLHEVNMDQEAIMSNIIHSPVILGLGQKVEAARANEKLAAKTTYPDITVGVDWINIDKPDTEIENGGKDAVALMFGMNIPLWSGKNNAVKSQAAAVARNREYSRQQELNDRYSQAEKLIYEINEAKRKIKLYGSVLGQKANDLVITSEAAYRSGTLEFFSLIDAQRLQLKYKLNYERAVVDYMQKISELEKLSGGTLSYEEPELDK